jgi:AraC-like DNA-binding protein
MRAKDEIPVLGIGEFRVDQQNDNGFQYHKICGSRVIGKPHKHDFFLFLLFEDGSGTHTIDFVEHPVASHQLHLLFPDQIHSWKLGDDTNAQQIMVSRHIFETFAHSLRYDLVLYQNHPVIRLDTETFQKLSYEFQAIEIELLTEPILWDIVSARCTIIAQMVSREAEKAFDDLRFFPAKPVLLEYRSLINIHFKEQKYVSFYAEKLNLTPNYLNILCRKHFHTSATSLIHSRLILEAKRLLLTSKNPVKEVAYDLGFYDLAYFSKFFKTQTGMSPRQFREL